MTDVDARAFWRLMGARPVGVPVVAASGPDGPAGFLALSVTHVSAEPPSMLVCVSQSTSALAAIRSSGAFSISYLPEGGEDIANIFGGRTGITGADRFAEGQWMTGVTGSPLLLGATASFECTVSASFPHEGTEIVVGRIAAWSTDEAAMPMVMFGGKPRGLR